MTLNEIIPEKLNCLFISGLIYLNDTDKNIQNSYYFKQILLSNN